MVRVREIYGTVYIVGNMNIFKSLKGKREASNKNISLFMFLLRRTDIKNAFISEVFIFSARIYFTR